MECNNVSLFISASIEPYLFVAVRIVPGIFHHNKIAPIKNRHSSFIHCTLISSLPENVIDNIGHIDCVFFIRTNLHLNAFRFLSIFSKSGIYW